MRLFGGVTTIADKMAPLLAQRRIALTILPLAALVPVLQFISLLSFAWKQTPNVPMYDEWYDTVPLVVKASTNQLTLLDLWAPHNEHRVLLPRLLQLPLIFLTHWNHQAELILNLLVGLGIGILFWVAARRTVRADVVALALICPISIFVLSHGADEDWMLAFNLTNILTIFGVAICVGGFAAFEAPAVSWRMFTLAASGALIASLSSAGGLFAWIAFFPVLLLLRAGYRKMLTWVGLALAIWIPYNVGLQHTEALVPPLDFLRYILLFLGAPVDGTDAQAALFFGIFGVSLLALDLVVFFVLRLDLRQVAVWLSLAFYELMLAVTGDIARAKVLGINEALTPRYAVLQMGWWVALVVLTAVAAQELARVVWGEGGLASQPPRIATLGAVVVLTVAIFTITAVTVMCGMNNQARSDVDYQNSGYLKKQQVCVLNYATAPDTCLALYQPFSPTLVREEAAELEQLHMGIFY